LVFSQQLFRVTIASPNLSTQDVFAALPLGLSRNADATAVAAAGFGYAFGVGKTPQGGHQ